jgi:WD40 repeat protein
LIAVASDNKVLVYDIGGKSAWPATPVATLVGHTGRVLCAKFSPDGKFLATGGEDKSVRIWSTASWGELTVLVELDVLNAVEDVSWFPDSLKIASAARHSGARIWDLLNVLEWTERGKEVLEGDKTEPSAKQSIGQNIRSNVINPRAVLSLGSAQKDGVGRNQADTDNDGDTDYDGGGRNQADTDNEGDTDDDGGGRSQADTDNEGGKSEDGKLDQNEGIHGDGGEANDDDDSTM